MGEPSLTDTGRFNQEAQARAARNLARWKVERKSAALSEVRDDLDAVVSDRARTLLERIHALLCRIGVERQIARYAAELNEKP